MFSKILKAFRTGSGAPDIPAGPADGFDHARSLLRQGRLPEAEAVCNEAIARTPDDVSLTLLAGEIAVAKGDLGTAILRYTQVIHLQPKHALAHYKLGNLNKDTGRLEAAIGDYDRAISIDPSNAYALCNRGVVLARLERRQEALESYDRAMALDPQDALVLFNRGILLRDLGRKEDAVSSYSRAVEARPDYLQALCNRANLLNELGRPDEAAESYDQAIRINPEYPEAYFGRASVLQGLGRLDDALADYDHVLLIEPQHAAAAVNRCVILMKLERWTEAQSSIERAIAAAPELPEAHLNRGGLLMHLKQWHSALASLDRAIALRPDLAEAHLRRGDILAAQMRLDGALSSYDSAIAVDRSYAHAYERRANVLVQMRRFGDAIASYDSAVEYKPDLPFAWGMRRYTRMSVCDWNGLDGDIERLQHAIRNDEAVSPPFPMLALVDDAALHRKTAEIWVRHQCRPSSDLPSIGRSVHAGKVRLGYFSGDLHEHAVATLMAQVFEMHDRTQFEVTAFSYGTPSQDHMRKRLEGAFDRFLDVHATSDREVALLARHHGIDIAVDLAGYTGNGRTRVFAHRAAPVQVNYLGYPGTMAAEYMDYVIADTTVIPVEQQPDYAEKVAYLPHAYLPHDSSRQVQAPTPLRVPCGLPAAGFVFCCFNNGYKITPGTFETWMRILGAVAGSVLWLSRNDPLAAANLRKEAARSGIDPQRLIFADRVPSPTEHLARYSLAGLFLDTLPYNAHATAIDALWMGCPVLTRTGTAFAGRVGASLLQALDVPELITTTAEQYERLAVQLATDPHRLGEIRNKLARNRRRSPLFDTAAFTRHLEQAYRRMVARHRSGLVPEHFSVEA
jgi:predicted O-linked N-acetylglucosamine transferase (SPINDLY family)